MNTAETIKEFETLLSQVPPYTQRIAYKFAYGTHFYGGFLPGNIQRASRFLRMIINTNQSKIHRINLGQIPETEAVERRVSGVGGGEDVTWLPMSIDNVDSRAGCDKPVTFKLTATDNVSKAFSNLDKLINAQDDLTQ